METPVELPNPECGDTVLTLVEAKVKDSDVSITVPAYTVGDIYGLDEMALPKIEFKIRVEGDDSISLSREDFYIMREGETIHQAMVNAFMERIPGQGTPREPCIPKRKVALLRGRLIFEEVLEALTEMGLQVVDAQGRIPTEPLRVAYIEPLSYPEDLYLPSIAKELADIAVVVTGTATAFGICMGPVQIAVDDNNLRKLGPGHEIRDDGKLIKPPGHPNPDMEKELGDQGWSDFPEDDLGV